MKISFDHCLRPEFTKLIYTTLRDQRRSLNLIGLAGLGKSRLIDDLFHCKFMQDTKIIRINFSEFKKNYQAFENSILSQLEISIDEKPAFDQAIESYLGKNKDVYIIFALDNFDSLCDNGDMDISYNRSYLGNLNALKNSGRVSLLCVTQKSVNTLTMFIQEEKEVNGQKVITRTGQDSPLYLDWKEISKLSESEIESELFRSAKKVKPFLANHPNLKKEIILFIQEYKYCYTLLEFCKDKLPSELDFLEKDTRKWKKEMISSLEANHKVSIDKRIRNWDITLKKWLDRTIRIMKIIFTLKKATTLWGKILQWIIRISVLMLGFFYKKILYWIELLFP